MTSRIKMSSPSQSGPIDEDSGLRAKILQTKCLPPIPDALIKLLEIIQNDEASTGELESVILQDQALAAKVLRVANSAYYGFCGRIITISRAIVTIGYHEVQNLSLCALLLEQFLDKKADQDAQRLLWQHAFTTAKLARGIAQQRPWMNRDEAYIVGLLHDLGRMVLMVHSSEEYHRIEALRVERNIPTYLAEKELGITHTKVGKWLAIKWHLPDLYHNVMEFHHDPSDSQGSQKETTLIYLADILAHFAESPERTIDEDIREACEQLYIRENQWQGYCDQALTVWEESNALWGVLR
jgi:HD-like signal output (HDOD) protein